jgi:hypothetical protein
MNRCDTCAAWSELIARSEGGGPVEALCLSNESPHSHKYTTGRMGCDRWTNNPAIADYPSERAPNARPR